MKTKDIKQYRQKLAEILRTLKQVEVREEKIVELAKEIGAEIISRQGTFVAREPELIDNIHDVLRTESTIELCRVASRNFWVVFAAAIAAVLSAGAAWIAVYKGH